MNDEKTYKIHQGWIFWLTGFWLIATFDHNYSTLSQFTLSKIWHVFGTEIPISDIANFLLVLALELTLFWSVWFIQTGKRWGVNLKFIYTMQIISTVISIVLNVKYMIESSPSSGLFDYGIGATIGFLIPIYVVLFGYIEGHVLDSRIDQAILKGNGKKVTADMIESAIEKNPHLSRRELADMFGVSTATVQNRFDEIRLKRGVA